MNAHIFLREEHLASQAQVYAIAASNSLYVTSEILKPQVLRSLIPGITLAK